MGWPHRGMVAIGPLSTVVFLSMLAVWLILGLAAYTLAPKDRP